MKDKKNDIDITGRLSGKPSDKRHSPLLAMRDAGNYGKDRLGITADREDAAQRQLMEVLGDQSVVESGGGTLGYAPPEPPPALPVDLSAHEVLAPSEGTHAPVEDWTAGHGLPNRWEVSSADAQEYRPATLPWTSRINGMWIAGAAAVAVVTALIVGVAVSSHSLKPFPQPAAAAPTPVFVPPAMPPVRPAAPVEPALPPVVEPVVSPLADRPAAPQPVWTPPTPPVSAAPVATPVRTPPPATQPAGPAPKVYIACPGDIRLTGIIRQQGGGFANINGRYVTIGDAVKGAKLIAIREFSVEMERDGEFFVVGVAAATATPDEDTPEESTKKTLKKKKKTSESQPAAAPKDDSDEPADDTAKPKPADSNEDDEASSADAQE